MATAEVADLVEAGLERERSLAHEEALARYDEALRRAREVGRPADLASVQARRGQVLLTLGRRAEAQAALDEALAASRDLDDPLVVGQALLAAGVFAAQTGDGARAEGFLLEALRRFFENPEDAAHRRGAGWAFINLGWLYGRMGRLDVAFVTLEKARQVLFAVEDWAGVAAAWEAQARLRQALGDPDRAREDFGEALVFYRRAGMAAKAERLEAVLGRPKLV